VTQETGVEQGYFFDRAHCKEVAASAPRCKERSVTPPADLPLQQSTTVEPLINLKTVRLTLSPDLFFIAGAVVEERETRNCCIAMTAAFSPLPRWRSPELEVVG
jgi:hypothetical protein